MSLSLLESHNHYIDFVLVIFIAFEADQCAYLGMLIFYFKGSVVYP